MKRYVLHRILSFVAVGISIILLGYACESGILSLIHIPIASHMVAGCTPVAAAVHTPARPLINQTKTVENPGEIIEYRIQESVYPEDETPAAVEALEFDVKIGKVLDKLGSVQINGDNPPEIIMVRTHSEVPIYTDFLIRVFASDDIGIAEVRIDFEKKGIPQGGIGLEEKDGGLFQAFYQFDSCGTFDYTITVTDTNGQTVTRTGQIVVCLYYQPLWLPPPPPPPPPDPD